MTIQGNVIELTKFLEINKSNYFKRDNGELKYTWVVHPNALSLGTQMIYMAQTLHYLQMG